MSALEMVTVLEHTDVCPAYCMNRGKKCSRYHQAPVERPVVTLKECAARMGLAVDWQGGAWPETQVIFNDRLNVNHVCAGGEVLYTFSGVYTERGQKWPSCAMYGFVSLPDGRNIAVFFA